MGCPCWKPTDFENELLAIPTPLTVVGARIQGELGIRHVVNKIKRINCVDNDIVISAHDQRRLLDVHQVSELLPAVFGLQWLDEVCRQAKRTLFDSAAGGIII